MLYSLLLTNGIYNNLMSAWYSSYETYLHSRFKKCLKYSFDKILLLIFYTCELKFRFNFRVKNNTCKILYVLIFSGYLYFVYNMVLMSSIFLPKGSDSIYNSIEYRNKYISLYSMTSCYSHTNRLKCLNRSVGIALYKLMTIIYDII